MTAQNETIARRPVVKPLAAKASTTSSSRPVAKAAPPSPAPSPREPVRAVRILRGENASTLALDEGTRYVLGRHDAADIVFDTPEVSRLHGVVRFADGAWRYEDYGSQNGSTLVRLDDIRTLQAHAPLELRALDIIELGGESARIELLPASELTSDTDDDDEAPASGKRAFDIEVSKAARAFSERVRLAARTRVPVFLLGPSGVGKTFTARQIHELSALPGPFVPVNCARLPQEPTALHSELLGHVKGAYTGAEGARTGKLVHADGGTLFLDEVESLPALAQGFLLDVLEGSGDLAPLGAQAPRLKPITFRVIAASKAPLGKSGLRHDLCERLAEGHLWRVPGLEERKEDIPGLLRRFADEQEKMLGTRVTVAPAAIRYCADASWPGQIRQLRSSVVALAQLGLARQDPDAREPIILRDTDFAAHIAERELAFGEDEAVRTKADPRSLTQAQLKHALLSAGGSRAAAARALGISRNTLAKKLRE